jgi:hypothetical protein
MIEVTVCVNPDGCAQKVVRTRKAEGEEPREYTPRELLGLLEKIVEELGVRDRVTLREKVCLWGCTFGPRIDVVAGDREFLYGREDYRGEISVRGIVEVRSLASLPSLRSLITEHLPLP